MSLGSLLCALRSAHTSRSSAHYTCAHTHGLFSAQATLHSRASLPPPPAPSRGVYDSRRAFEVTAIKVHGMMPVERGKKGHKIWWSINTVRLCCFSLCDRRWEGVRGDKGGRGAVVLDWGLSDWAKLRSVAGVAKYFNSPCFCVINKLIFDHQRLRKN